MTVWIYEIGEGEYEEAAVVENGVVVSGDNELVQSAFPDGIPDDEAVVARAFTGPATISSTDFEVDWQETPGWADGEEIQASDGGELAEFEDWMARIHTDFVAAEDTSKTLTQFSESQLPEMVEERMKEAIRGGAVFSHFEDLPSSELMDLRGRLTDMLTDDEWSLDTMAAELSDRFDVSEDKAETWARTETQSIANHAYEDAVTELEEERGEEFRYKWVGNVDDRTTDACEWLLEQTNPDYGGTPVTLERLKALIQEAPEHDDDLDTQAREFTPHINCRKRFVRHVE